MAVDLALSKSPSNQVSENHFDSAASSGVIISPYSKQKDSSSNFFTLNPFMEASPANLDSPLASGVIHRHTPNHLILADNSKNSYFNANTNQTSPEFQSSQRSSVHNNFLNSQSPARTDFDLSARQQQDSLLFSHSMMFEPASTSANTYNHSYGIFGANPVNLHGPSNLNLMNSTVDIKPSSLQSLPAPHPFYSHSALTPSHDQSTVQRPGMSPLLTNPMGYRGYPQINELFPARPDFYPQQTPFGHPQYW